LSTHSALLFLQVDDEGEASPKKKVKRVKIEVENTRTKRASTAERTLAGKEEREWREEEEAENRARRNRRKSKTKKKKRLTQEELLAEAAHTEIVNARSLQALLDIEMDAKLKNQVKKVKQEGAIIREFSYGGQSLITFTDPKGLPSNFDNVVLEPTKPSVCIITGLPAKYKDPVTGHPYATLEAFKKIRDGHTVELATKDTLQAAVATV